MRTRENGDTAKYKRIYRELHEALTVGRYRPGDKLPSENELVTQFGASRPTVGRALAKLESEGLLQRRAGAGTFVRVADREPAHVFGLLIPELGQTEIFEPICQGLSHARGGKHHELLWGPTVQPGASKELQTEQLCESYRRRGVSGVFFAPLELTEGKDEVNIRITNSLDDAHIPVVLLDRDICAYPKRSKYDLVGIDNRRAGFVITEHLLLAGCKRIVFFARPNSAPTVDARASGYRDALRIYLQSATNEMVEVGEPADIPTVRDLISRLRPEAFVCANDYTAAHLMTTLNTLGVSVPSQIRVTGIDDVKYASVLNVPLTTIHQPCQAIGATALLAMLDRISHPNAPARDFLVEFELVVRQSSGATSNKISQIHESDQHR